jgi:hypothetical protein
MNIVNANVLCFYLEYIYEKSNHLRLDNRRCSRRQKTAIHYCESDMCNMKDDIIFLFDTSNILSFMFA